MEVCSRGPGISGETPRVQIRLGSISVCADNLSIILYLKHIRQMKRLNFGWIKPLVLWNIPLDICASCIVIFNCNIINSYINVGVPYRIKNKPLFSI